jgi:hypothetical protein
MFFQNSAISVKSQPSTEDEQTTFAKELLLVGKRGGSRRGQRKHSQVFAPALVHTAHNRWDPSVDRQMLQHRDCSRWHCMFTDALHIQKSASLASSALQSIPRNCVHRMIRIALPMQRQPTLQRRKLLLMHNVLTDALHVHRDLPV